MGAEACGARLLDLLSPGEPARRRLGAPPRPREASDDSRRCLWHESRRQGRMDVAEVEEAQGFPQDPHSRRREDEADPPWRLQTRGSEKEDAEALGGADQGTLPSGEGHC